MNKDQIWNIVLIISIILIIHGMTKTGSSDKKEAQAGASETTLGAVGAAGSFIAKKTVWWYGFLAVTAALPFIINQWDNLFSPQPTIPLWVYVIGFIILFMFVIRKK